MEQIDEINKSFKWEIEALKQELTGEAEGNIAGEICQLQKQKELRLLQQEEFARKDVELKAEQIKRKFMAQLAEEKHRLEDEQHEMLAHLKEAFESKI